MILKKLILYYEQFLSLNIIYQLVIIAVTLIIFYNLLSFLIEKLVFNYYKYFIQHGMIRFGNVAELIFTSIQLFLLTLFSYFNSFIVIQSLNFEIMFGMVIAVLTLFGVIFVLGERKKSNVRYYGFRIETRKEKEILLDNIMLSNTFKFNLIYFTFCPFVISLLNDSKFSVSTKVLFTAWLCGFWLICLITIITVVLINMIQTYTKLRHKINEEHYNKLLQELWLNSRIEKIFSDNLKKALYSFNPIFFWKSRNRDTYINQYINSIQNRIEVCNQSEVRNFLNLIFYWTRENMQEYRHDKISKTILANNFSTFLFRFLKIIDENEGKVRIKKDNSFGIIHVEESAERKLSEEELKQSFTNYVLAISSILKYYSKKELEDIFFRYNSMSDINSLYSDNDNLITFLLPKFIFSKKISEPLFWSSINFYFSILLNAIENFKEEEKIEYSNSFYDTLWSPFTENKQTKLTNNERLSNLLNLLFSIELKQVEKKDYYDSFISSLIDINEEYATNYLKNYLEHLDDEQNDKKQIIQAELDKMKENHNSLLQFS